MGLKALDLSVMLYMTTGFNVRVSHREGLLRLVADVCGQVEVLICICVELSLSRGQGAERGEKESVLQVLDAVAGREPPLTPAAGSKPPAA